MSHPLPAPESFPKNGPRSVGAPARQPHPAAPTGSHCSTTPCQPSLDADVHLSAASVIRIWKQLPTRG